MKVLVFRSNTTQNGILIKDISFDRENLYPVVLNFDNHKDIGSARLSKDNNGDIYANILFRGDLHGKFYPAMGCSSFKLDCELVWRAEIIGLCSNPNVDPEIKSIEL